MSYALIDIKRIKAWFFDRKVKKLIKKANKLQKLTNSKFVVMIIGGRPRIYKKKDLRLLVNKHAFKVKNVDELLKHAVHITST